MPSDTSNVIWTAVGATALFTAGSLFGLMVGPSFGKDKAGKRKIKQEKSKLITVNNPTKEDSENNLIIPSPNKRNQNTLLKNIFIKSEDASNSNNENSSENFLPSPTISSPSGETGSIYHDANSNIPLTSGGNTTPSSRLTINTATNSIRNNNTRNTSERSSRNNSPRVDTSMNSARFTPISADEFLGTGATIGRRLGTSIGPPVSVNTSTSVADHPLSRVTNIESNESLNDSEISEEIAERLGEQLYIKAEVEARTESCIHRSITCNTCGQSPIKGIRYKCGNCIDYDICSNCAKDDDHATNHIFVKITIPIPPLMNPRTRMFECIYPGTISIENITEFNYETFKKNPYFNYLEMEALFNQYISLLTNPDGITMQVFCQCLGPLSQERNIIIDRFFSFFDRNNNGLIDFEEFALGIGVLCKGKHEERIKYAFQGYDFDNLGVITKYNLKSMLKAYFTLSMELVRDVVKGMELNIVETYDEKSTNPVSSMFTAPIPTGTAEVLHEAYNETRANNPLALNRSTRDGSLTVNTTIRNRISGPASAVTPLDGLRRAAELTPYRILMDDNLDIAATITNKDSATSIGSGNSDNLPILETLSLDAIDGMVEAIFEKKRGLILKGESYDELRARQSCEHISFEEFSLLAESDSGILSWFEALGSVF